MPIDLLPGSSIQANTIAVAQMNPNTWAQVYSALASANAAYSQANTAYTQANNAYSQANTAYTQANSAYSQANTKASIGLVIALS